MFPASWGTRIYGGERILQSVQRFNKGLPSKVEPIVDIEVLMPHFDDI